MCVCICVFCGQNEKEEEEIYDKIALTNGLWMDSGQSGQWATDTIYLMVNRRPRKSYSHREFERWNNKYCPMRCEAKRYTRYLNQLRFYLPRVSSFSVPVHCVYATVIENVFIDCFDLKVIAIYGEGFVNVKKSGRTKRRHSHTHTCVSTVI